MRDIESEILQRETSEFYSNPIDVFGIEHIGILFISLAESSTMMTAVFRNPEGYPMLTQIEWYGIEPSFSFDVRPLNPEGW